MIAKVKPLSLMTPDDLVQQAGTALCTCKLNQDVFLDNRTTARARE